MSHDAFNPKPPRRKGFKERRGPRGTPGSLRWIQGLLGRPLRVERRGLQVHLLLEDRRRPPQVQQADALEALRDELRARLLGHDRTDAVELMQEIALVHDLLGRRGWSGVENLPSAVLGRAALQAQLFVTQEPTELLEDLVERLGVLRVAAEVREDRVQRAQNEDSVPAVVVSESSQEEFDAMERSWVGTIPQPLTPAERS